MSISLRSTLDCSVAGNIPRTLRNLPSLRPSRGFGYPTATDSLRDISGNLGGPWLETRSIFVGSVFQRPLWTRHADRVFREASKQLRAIAGVDVANSRSIYLGDTFRADLSSTLELARAVPSWPHNFLDYLAHFAVQSGPSAQVINVFWVSGTVIGGGIGSTVKPNGKVRTDAFLNVPNCGHECGDEDTIVASPTTVVEARIHDRRVVIFGTVRDNEGTQGDVDIADSERVTQHAELLLHEIGHAIGLCHCNTQDGNLMAQLPFRQKAKTFVFPKQREFIELSAHGPCPTNHEG